MRRSFPNSKLCSLVAAAVCLAGSVGLAAELTARQAADRANELLAKEIGTSATAKPVGRADDETFLRRVSLDLIGRPPSVEEVTAFVLDPAADKRARAVERMLADPRFGLNWARYWRDVILSRRSDDRGLVGSQALEEYLSNALNQGTPWHEIATAFITASGDVRENGTTALIMAQMGETEEIAAEVSRIFMGVQIQCAQCHDHPTDRWKRQQFHELAAFFPRIEVRPKLNSTPRSFEVVSVNIAPRFRGGMMRRANTEHYMSDLKDPTSKGTLIQPKFFVTDRQPEPGLADPQRRETLAAWMTSPSNPWFAKAFVNRIWSELVGEGFYEPVDDMGPDRSCSAPETLQFLATQFSEHQHDPKWLFQAIIATEAYQRGSRPRRNPDQTPFVANCNQRLRADQLYDSILSALGLEDFPQGFSAARTPQTGGGYFGLRGPRQLFSAAFGYDPSTPRDEVAGSIPQALLMMNSPLIESGIDGNRSTTALGRILRESQDDDAVVAELYLRCLAREPSTLEVSTCLAHVRQVGNRVEGFEDILWALLNSAEFLHRK